MSSNSTTNLKIRFRCAMKGHDREWLPGSISAGWRCTRCGRRGRLDEASELPLGEHLVHLVASLVVVALVLGLIKLIF